MQALEINHVSKYFGGKAAVQDLSFSVSRGEIFGLIGPNGAGKSTTIRMAMDLIKPDSGSIAVFGEQFSEATKNQLGYMPEERGLYRKLKVIDTILYMSSLKGVAVGLSREKAQDWLHKTGMWPHRNKKIDELSKGMGQIIQFIVTVIHNPDLIILDEPFSGLDPVNTELLRRMFFDLRNQGKALILSTHRMNEVEELCDRILMINNGSAVLYGGLKEVKSAFKSNTVLLEIDGDLTEIPGVTVRKHRQGEYELLMDADTSPQKVLQYLAGGGIVVNRFEIATPSLNEIFLKVAGKNYE
jgi:ABC-2 type transport system ATP-binding protein